VSLRLYSTGVLWERGKGAAKLYGVMLALTSPPEIRGALILAIRYIPEIGLRTVTREGDATERTLTDEEARAVDAWLRRSVL